MAAYSNVVVDDSGYRRPIVGAQVYTLNKDGSTAASATPQPAVTDSFGAFTVSADDGVYVLDYRVAGVSYYKETVTIGTPPEYVGPPGGSDNTYTTLAAFKASDISRKTASLVGVPGVPDGRFNWTAGNYTGQTDDQNIIKADSTALTTGAWVRQGAPGIITRPSLTTVIRTLSDEVNDDLRLDRLLTTTQLQDVRNFASTYDVGTLLQDLVSGITSSRKFATLRSFGGKFRSTKKIDLDVQYVQLGLSSQIDFTGLTDAYAIGLSRSDGFGSQIDRRPRLAGLNLLGPGKSSGIHGIRMIPASGDLSAMSISDLSIRSFGRGFDVGDNVYVVEIEDFYIGLCDTGFHKVNGVNAGEKIAFRGGAFAGCGTCIYLDDISADLTCTSVSFDYPEATGGGRWIVANRGIVSASQCHFEGNNLSSPMGAASPLYMGPNNSAKVEISDSWIGFAQPFATAYVFENANTEKAMDVGAFVMNARGLNGVMGSGRINARMEYYDGSGFHTNGVITSLSENLNPDDFSGGTPLTAYLSADTAPITSRLSGNSGAISTSGGALALTKAAGQGAGSTFQASIAVRINGPAVVGTQFRVAKPGTLTGPLAVLVQYATGYWNSLGAFVPTKTLDIVNTTPVTFASAAQAATLYQLGTANIRRPAWADHVVLTFVMSNIVTTDPGSGPINVTDLCLTNARIS